jgi:hypothetical protein
MKKLSLPYCMIPAILFCLIILNACNNAKTSAPIANTDVIQKYLDEKVMQPSFGGKVFSAHKIFKTENDKIYLWAYLMEYYKKDGKTEQGSGWSVPLVLNTTGSGANLIITSHQAPGDGDMYGEDIKKLFPKDIQQQVFDFSGSPEMPSLEKKSKDRSAAL